MQKMCGLHFFDEALEPHSWRQNRSGKKKIGLKEDPFGRLIDYDLKYSIEGV
jgi:hypothetical protein